MWVCGDSVIGMRQRNVRSVSHTLGKSSIRAVQPSGGCKAYVPHGGADAPLETSDPPRELKRIRTRAPQCAVSQVSTRPAH